MDGRQQPPLRIGHVEREWAVEALGEHLSHGRLGATEYGDRVARASVARWQAELDELFFDLPAAEDMSPQATQQQCQGRAREQLLVSLPEDVRNKVERSSLLLDVVIAATRDCGLSALFSLVGHGSGGGAEAAISLGGSQLVLGIDNVGHASQWRVAGDAEIAVLVKRTKAKRKSYAELPLVPLLLDQLKRENPRIKIVTIRLTDEEALRSQGPYSEARPQSHYLFIIPGRPDLCLTLVTVDDSPCRWHPGHIVD